MTILKNYYQVLQVDRAAEKETIEAAYRRLAAKYHPDVSNASNATLRMQEINEAYNTLRDANKRFLYDQHLAVLTPSASHKYKGEREKYTKKGTTRHRDYQHRFDSSVSVPQNKLDKINKHSETDFPYISGGFLLGYYETDKARTVIDIFAAPNFRNGVESRKFITLAPEDYLNAELVADRLGLHLIGIYYSSPDYPSRPSEYTRVWAQPFFSYVITSVQTGKAVESRSWRLVEDRTKFEEEEIKLGN